jgi:hypothetical protein
MHATNTFLSSHIQFFHLLCPNSLFILKYTRANLLAHYFSIVLFIVSIFYCHFFTRSVVLSYEVAYICTLLLDILYSKYTARSGQRNLSCADFRI